MQKLYFSEGLLGKDWAKNIRLTLAPDGMILNVATDVEAPEGEAVYGPVLPAMPNLHSHAFQRAFAGLAEFKEAGAEDFWSWRLAMYHFAQHMTPEALEVIASQLYLEMLKAGYSAVGEFHYLHNSHRDEGLAMSEAIMKAADKTGIALTHLPVFYEASDFGGKPAESGQKPFLHTPEDFDRVLQVLSAKIGGRHRLGMAFHSLRAVKEESFPKLINSIEKISLSAPIHIHIAEQMKEVNASVDHSGKRPIEWLMDTQPVDERWCLVHATHLLESEWKQVAESGAVVGLCPVTEANLGDGLFPLPEYLKHKGAWGIGSDSHISIDAREELRLLEYGQRLARQERTVLTGPGGGHTGEYLWRTAAQGGAKALAQPVGEIAEGKRADLLVLDMDQPMFAGAAYSQIIDVLVFSGQANPISHVMVAGQWVIKDGKHACEQEITSRYNALVSKIAAKLEDT
jgi:formimidoylglutamate deiminase